ncbi:energy-coupling factor transporter ATP-binding protein EcfA2 [Microvirga lupini]|uniref:Energy-coupling factor transporter ATP-binding protein EcfA2 n=1 Tax=Microvirga lupini TaxID=420324 RepID=A0A7W4VHS8_9HYPH|nr:shikimate kinase [Microvirga lupini]MBB3017470.1 energy-coupling factor transporter ATP-binding protein EcfA2 [Microvirga lupini]
MLTVVHINGPINSGKSTLGRALAGSLPDAAFVDGDDHEAADDAPLAVRIETALSRIEAEIVKAQGRYFVVAYPLEEADHPWLKRVAERRGARLLVLTLAPPLDVALTERGTRKLSSEEKSRIVEMYEEGYHARSFSNLVLDTSLSLSETLETARAMILRSES